MFVKIQVERKVLMKMMRQHGASFENTIFTIRLDDNSEHVVTARGTQFHPGGMFLFTKSIDCGQLHSFQRPIGLCRLIFSNIGLAIDFTSHSVTSTKITAPTFDVAV